MSLTNKIRSAFSSQCGVTHLLMVALLLGGVILAVVLVQNGTNIVPHAQQPEINLTPQTAFHLHIDKNYTIFEDAKTNQGSQIVPKRSWFRPGEEIRVNVAISSDIEQANTFSAVINFPADLLEVVSIQKENNQPVAQPENSTTKSEGARKTLPGEGCKISGCSGQLCVAEGESGISTCEWKDEYACYGSAKCEKQPSGKCGWTQTPELQQCLSGGGIPGDPRISCDENAECPVGYSCQSRSTCTAGGACTTIEGSECVSDSSPTVGDYFIELWLPGEDFNNATGQISLSGGVKNPSIKTSPPNKPVMATIVFKAKKVGEAKLDFTEDSLILGSINSENILKNKYGLTISIKDQVVKTGDMDGDGVVGFKDFSIWLTKWGTPDTVGDLNGDGAINIFDFSILISNWKK
jgi:hypothetical protein